jgi:hypothetical protein
MFKTSVFEIKEESNVILVFYDSLNTMFSISLTAKSVLSLDCPTNTAS